MSKPDGGPAFPTTDPNYEAKYASAGMTLRDYFAARAIPIVAGQEALHPTLGDEGPTYSGIASRAYLLADAMLAERNKGADHE
ncbi:MAG: hypothetical protein ACE15D_18860 [Candidatus Eisenbacteria bacterium]